MEGKHADADCRTHTTSTTLNPEPISVLPHLHALNRDVTSGGFREGNIGTIGGLLIFFLLDHLLKLLDECVTTRARGISRIFRSQFCTNILFQVLLHWQLPEPKSWQGSRHGWIISRVCRAGMVTGNTFVLGWECLTRADLAEHGSEAEPIVGSAVHCLDGAVAAQDGVHNGTTLLFLAFQELEKVGVSRVAQNDAVFVGSIELGDIVGLHMFRQADGFKLANIVCVLGKEHVLVGIEELLCILGVECSDHVEERIDKEWPQYTAKLGLVEIEILLNPCLEQVYAVWSVRILDKDNEKRLFTEALSELRTGIFSERGKWASIDLLVG